MATKFDAPQYLQLNKGGVMARMSILRNTAATYNTVRPAMPRPSVDGKPTTWRDARGYGFGNWHDAYSALSQAGKHGWYCYTGEQFRNEQDAADIWSMDHTGWYCDPDGDNLCIGIVAQLSHGRYIAGYRLTDSGERVYLDKVYSDDEEAARAADEEARIYGETEYAHKEKYQDAQDLNSSITDNIADVGPAFALRHHHIHGANSRDLVHEAIREVRRLQSILADDYSDVEL